MSDFDLKTKKKLVLLSQEHLIDPYSKLSDRDKELFSLEIDKIDSETFLNQLNTLVEQKTQLKDLQPLKTYQKCGSKEKKEVGLKHVKKCLAILIAGGQGTRLGHRGPKGTFPICPLTQDTLFKIFCKKVLRSSSEVSYDLPLAIMTSPLNDTETRSYFEKNSFFGLKKDNVYFFCQDECPLLDQNGHLIFKDKTHLQKGPNGNGDVYQALKNAHLVEKFKSLGIEYINFVMVDNILADPYDFEFFGELISSNADVSLKSCQRLSPKEHVGIILEHQSKPIVVEYFELPKDLEFIQEPMANLSLLCMRFDFILSILNIELPLHLAHKKTDLYSHEKNKIINEQECIKYEKFIFDVLKYSKKTTVVEYQRKHVFAPLKKSEGSDSPQTVRSALLNLALNS